MAKTIKRIGAQKVPQSEIDKQVAEIVQYLLEKQEIDAMLSDSFHDKPGLAAELDSIISALAQVERRVTALHSHFEMGRLDPFFTIQKRVFHCWDAAVSALVQARCAQKELAIEHPQRTRSLDLQRSAVRLAVAYFESAGRGQARARAKEIMQKAGLPDPDESTFTNWIQEFRNQ